MSANETERPSHADVLFGGTTTAPSAPPTTVTSPPPPRPVEKTTEEVLFAAHPRPPVKAGEGLSHGDIFFRGDIAYRDAFREQAEKWHDDLGLTADETRTTQRAYVEDFERHKINPYTSGRTLMDALVTADVEDYRGVAEPDEPTIRAWEAESRRWAREQYGQQRGDLLLDMARDQIETLTPRLHDALGRRGLGSRPDLVQLLVECVQQQNPHL